MPINNCLFGGHTPLNESDEEHIIEQIVNCCISSSGFIAFMQTPTNMAYTIIARELEIIATPEATCTIGGNSLHY